jgi:hypothetical protein
LRRVQEPGPVCAIDSDGEGTIRRMALQLLEILMHTQGRYHPMDTDGTSENEENAIGHFMTGLDEMGFCDWRTHPFPTTTHDQLEYMKTILPFEPMDFALGYILRAITAGNEREMRKAVASALEWTSRTLKG